MRVIKTISTGLAATLFTAVAAQATPLLRCEEDLMPKDGPKTVVEVNEMAQGAYEATIDRTVNRFGAVEHGHGVIGGLRCEKPAVVVDDKMAVALDKLFCGQDAYAADGTKKDIAVLKDEVTGTYRIYETTVKAPPPSNGGPEIGMIPGSKSRTLGKGFACTLTLKP